MLMGIALCQLPADTVAEGWEPQEKILTKSNSGNPMLGFDENGEILYGGDPSIMVDGDTVYAYVGNDVSTARVLYHAPVDLLLFQRSERVEV